SSTRGRRHGGRPRARRDRPAARPPTGSTGGSARGTVRADAVGGGHALARPTTGLASRTRRPLTASFATLYMTPTDWEPIGRERAEGVATIPLHRPERLNAWTPAMGRELLDAFRAADRDRDVRAVILTGAGRAFCAGADMEFFAGQIRAGGGTGAAG